MGAVAPTVVVPMEVPQGPEVLVVGMPVVALQVLVESLPERTAQLAG